MEEKILGMLKTKATAFGFSETELSEAAKTIASFINNAEATDEEITSKVDLMLPVLGLSQKAANRAIEKAKKSAEEAAKKQQAATASATASAGAQKQNQPQTTPEDKTKTEEVPAWFKNYMEGQEKKTSELEKKLAEMSAEKTLTTRKAKLEELVKDSGVFGTATLKAFEKMTFGSDEEYDTYINGVKSDLETLKKERTDAGWGTMKPMERSKGAPEKKLTDEEVKGIAANL